MNGKCRNKRIFLKETSISYVQKHQFYLKIIKHINENVEKYLKDMLILHQGNSLPILPFRKIYVEIISFLKHSEKNCNFSIMMNKSYLVVK